MDLRRVRVGEWIAAVGGVVLLASLFLPWYEGPGGSSVTGFEALAVIDVVLAIAALLGIGLLFLTASQPTPAVPLALNGLIALMGTIAAVLALIRVLALPDAAEARDIGVWLGLAGALGVGIGGWVAMRDERLSRPGRPTDVSGRPVPEQREVEVLPEPDTRGARS